MFEITSADAEASKFVHQSLRKYNIENIGELPYKELNLIVCDSDNELMAGISGSFFWGCLELAWFWYKSSDNQQQIIDFLLKYVEIYALKQTVTNIYTKAIGEKKKTLLINAGYKVYGSLTDRPLGYTCYYLYKTPADIDLPSVPEGYILAEIESSSDPVMQKLIANIDQENNERFGEYPFEMFSYKATDQDKIIGGVAGYIGWNWLYIDILWVDKSHRQQKLGSRLMQTAEDLARNKGIPAAFLGTAEFQSPQFYQKLGYQEYGIRYDLPPGYKCYSMKKSIL
jgi:ribosomal protein S18 acetylase RimI-like enzyme